MIQEITFTEMIPVPDRTYAARFASSDGWAIALRGDIVVMSRDEHADGHWGAVAPFEVHGVGFVCSAPTPAETRTTLPAPSMQAPASGVKGRR